MEQLFVIGDVHGSYSKLKSLLKHWNPDKEQLIFLGDLIDRGPQSREVVQLAIQLQKEYGALVIGGNHEDIFLDWLQAPMQQMNFYSMVGGEETLVSFYDEKYVQTTMPETIAKQIQEDFHEEIAFLRSLPDYLEKGDHLFVHAGVNLDLRDWRLSGKQFFRTIREPFHSGKNQTGRIIVFGHTPTRRLHEDKRDDIWMAPCQTKIGIDGAAVFGGLLHGLRINENGTYTQYSIGNNNHKAEKNTFHLK